MISLGYTGNFSASTSTSRRSARELGTHWAYVAFFTKYPLAHFAYALKPKLVMQYDNDGWGPDNIDRVFTHETGHIFGCPDEYASSNCSMPTKFGCCREPNGNCQTCATSSGRLPDERQHLGHVQLHADAPRLARYRW